MSAIDRIMRAYSSKHPLNQVQSALIREELSAFIGDLLSGKRLEFPRASAAEQCAFTGDPGQGAPVKIPPCRQRGRGPSCSRGVCKDLVTNVCTIPYTSVEQRTLDSLHVVPDTPH